MEIQTALVGAVGTLWAALTSGAIATVRWLVEDRKTMKAEHAAQLEAERVACRQEISRRDTKLDGASDLMSRQAESQQKQIDSLNQMVAVLQTALAQGKPQ